MSKATSDNT